MSDEKIYTRLYHTIEEILDTAKKANNHRIAEFNINNRRLDKNAKGSIGQIVEEGIFHYPLNSNAEADFSNLGVELKVTGLKLNKNKTFSMKERLVLNIINYDNEAIVSFEDSSFWKKNQQILIMFYLYEYERNDLNFLILDSILHKFLSKDLEIIKQDWMIINNKIRSGQAHNISEADTMYLAACTKGANASSLRKQPYSPILAKQRAYCLKSSYMNALVKRNFNSEKLEEIVNFDELKYNTFENILRIKFQPFFGKNEDELFSLFNIDQHTKNKFNLLCSKILGINGSINKSEEFSKANIELKTIRVEENDRIREHMSFPHFTYIDIVKHTFEESDIFDKFNTTKFLFVIFKKENGKYYFNDITLWNMPYCDIERYVQPVFELTKDIVSNGNIVNHIVNKKFITNFPGSTFNHVCHVRPHDTKSVVNSGKGLPLPVKDKVSGLNKYTKHCFWLDSSYILNILKSKKCI